MEESLTIGAEGRRTSLQDLDQVRIRVRRSLLDFYDRTGAWCWYYLTDGNISLAELAYAFDRKDHIALARLVDRGTLSVHTSLRFIPGSDFFCIYYRDAVFFLQPSSVTDRDGGKAGHVMAGRH